MRDHTRGMVRRILSVFETCSSVAFFFRFTVSVILVTNDACVDDVDVDGAKGLYSSCQQGTTGDGRQHHSLLFDAGVGIPFKSAAAAVSPSCRKSPRTLGKLGLSFSSE